MENTMIILIVCVLLLAGFIALVLMRGGSSSTQTTSTIKTTASSTTSSISTTTTTTIIPYGYKNVTPITNVSDDYTLQLYNGSEGQYMVNASGFSLYIYSQDAPYNGTSSCYSPCSSTWKPFYASFLNVPSELDRAKLGMIIRQGGPKQLTYDGYPLYLYIGDKQPRQVNGNGAAGYWNLATYPNLNT